MANNTFIIGIVRRRVGYIIHTCDQNHVANQELHGKTVRGVEKTKGAKHCGPSSPWLGPPSCWADQHEHLQPVVVHEHFLQRKSDKDFSFKFKLYIVTIIWDAKMV
jgi:hypothetical protein